MLLHTSHTCVCVFNVCLDDIKQASLPLCRRKEVVCCGELWSSNPTPPLPMRCYRNPLLWYQGLSHLITRLCGGKQKETSEREK